MQNGTASPATAAREATGIQRPHEGSASRTVGANPWANPAADLTGQARSACDYSAALWTVGNDVDFFIEMARRFVGASPKVMAHIAAHLADEDLKAVEDAAVGLECSLRHLAAKPASVAARKLETAARKGDLSELENAFQGLQHEMARLGPELTRIGRQLTRREF